MFCFFLTACIFNREKGLFFCLVLVFGFFFFKSFCFSHFTGNLFNILKLKCSLWLFLLIWNKYSCSSLLSCRHRVILAFVFFKCFLNLQQITHSITSTHAHDSGLSFLLLIFCFLYWSNHIQIFFIYALSGHFPWWFASAQC